MMDNFLYFSGHKSQTLILLKSNCCPVMFFHPAAHTDGKIPVNRVKVQIMSSRLNRFLVFISQSRVPLCVFNKSHESLFLKSADVVCNQTGGQKEVKKSHVMSSP